LADLPRRDGERGAWIKPFGKLGNVMPACVMNAADIEQVCGDP
jgi:adenosylmethionine-8-amino-7-oxononanoate aminotransferase